MPTALSTHAASDFFMPHGHCYLWEPALVGLQVVSNGAIAAAYISIFLTLVYLVRRIKDIPFQWMYVAFAIFIVACGITHVFDVYVIWQPAYWTDGAIRAVTALASVGTAMMLPPLVPKAVALAEGASLAHERGLRIEDANKKLAVLLDKTTEIERLKTQFFANVSHELRTPLALILGPLQELLAAENLSAAQRRDVSVALRNARALLVHVNDLLDAAKLEGGKVTVDYAGTDLTSLVQVTTSYFEALATERRISLRVETPPTLRAEVDAEKVQRALLNLLSNAFKFTPEGGAVEVVLAGSAEQTVRLEVSDTGPGIAPADRERVFERYQQLDGGSTQRFGGTGLGLAIAKEFIELHNGTLRVRDGALGGATFEFELPLKAPQDVSVRAAHRANLQLEAQQAVEALAAPTQNEREGEPEDDVSRHSHDRPLALVVEDNPDLNQFLSVSLSQQLRVASARDGREGLRMALELQPDVIVTDLMMPAMGGDELLAAVRAEASLRDVPVVVLTAKADDESRLRLLRQGAQDYLLKPFSAEEVRIRVHSLVAVKRARDTLRAELNAQSGSLAELAVELAARQSDLNTALASLRVARDQALRASEVKTDFLALVSHELRTPLTVARLQVDRLNASVDASLDGKLSKIVSRLAGATTRLEQLVESLLTYASIQSGKVEMQIERVELAPLITSTTEEVRPQADAKQIQIALDLEPRDITVVTDPQLVHLVVLNLLVNAIKFTEKGSIRVRLRRDGDSAEISVSDTGPGIPAHEQARIFEPFEQLESVRRKHTPGVGLGLAIVRELVQALGAEVGLASEPGQGSTFRLTIPDQAQRKPWSSQ